jgi:hypothetical protein
MAFAMSGMGWRAVADDFTQEDLHPGETLVAELSEEVLYQIYHAQIPALIAARRYESETSGITQNGMFIDTGRDSQALITGAALSAMLDPAYVCNWKTSEGFVQLDAQTLIGIAQAIRAHVQACFDREAVLLTALENGSFVEDMLNGGWPA